METKPRPFGLSRRSFVQQSAAALVTASTLNVLSPTNAQAAAPLQNIHSSTKFLDIHRSPDIVRVYTGDGDFVLSPAGSGVWASNGVAVTAHVNERGTKATLTSPDKSVTRIHFRWNGTGVSDAMYLGDTWERAYGDLAWRSLEPNRIMPWYFIASDGTRSHCYGVETGPGAFCYWLADSAGISLWADVRSGGTPLQLGQRTLDIATIVSRQSQNEETPFETLHAFCKQMCPAPRLPKYPIFGHNDWDYYYGSQTTESTLKVARTVVSLTPHGTNHPYIVIDDGWEGDGNGAVTRGPWDHGNPKFPDLPGLASNIKQIGGRPGIWLRPTSAWDGLPDNWRLSRSHDTLDPTVPEAKTQISDDIKRIKSWGFELIKPDFLTIDIMGRFGPEMGASLTDDGWTFREGPIRTTAEVVKDLYQTIRDAAGDMAVIGCNTLSHLAAGLFEAARIGDDTSGTNWERTRKMGVNCLGFRSAQNRAFYAVDPDIAPITKGLPWEKSRQWLELVSASAAVLFVSIDDSVMGPEQTEALRRAFALAANSNALPIASPSDWMNTSSPNKWTVNGRGETFDWILAEGATPFQV